MVNYLELQITTSPHKIPNPKPTYMPSLTAIRTDCRRAAEQDHPQTTGRRVRLQGLPDLDGRRRHSRLQHRAPGQGVLRPLRAEQREIPTVAAGRPAHHQHRDDADQAAEVRAVPAARLCARLADDTADGNDTDDADDADVAAVDTADTVAADAPVQSAVQGHAQQQQRR